jgi:hypothetical protein
MLALKAEEAVKRPRDSEAIGALSRDVEGTVGTLLLLEAILAWLLVWSGGVAGIGGIEVVEKVFWCERKSWEVVGCCV